MNINLEQLSSFALTFLMTFETLYLLKKNLNALFANYNFLENVYLWQKKLKLHPSLENLATDITIPTNLEFDFTLHLFNFLAVKTLIITFWTSKKTPKTHI